MKYKFREIRNLSTEFPSWTKKIILLYRIYAKFQNSLIENKKMKKGVVRKNDLE